MSKKSISVLAGIGLFIVMACNATFSVGYPTPTIVPPAHHPTANATPELSISQQVTLVSAPFNEAEPGGTFPAYTITAQTPQLIGSTDPRVQALNQRLGNLVEREVDQWRQDFQQLPMTPFSNGSSLEATFTLISQIDELWSFKFDFSFYADTAAHPGLYSITLNYDLGQGREITLGDLFLPNSNYLEMAASYCITELRRKSYSNSFTTSGADPTFENYRNWNITPDGLMITFDAYQVAPGAAGPQIVIVPYDQLQGAIDPRGPLATFIP